MPFIYFSLIVSRQHIREWYQLQYVGHGAALQNDNLKITYHWCFRVLTSRYV